MVKLLVKELKRGEEVSQNDRSCLKKRLSTLSLSASVNVGSALRDAVTNKIPKKR
jgi:hypothetical protein